MWFHQIVMKLILLLNIAFHEQQISCRRFFVLKAVTVILFLALAYEVAFLIGFGYVLKIIKRSSLGEYVSLENEIGY